MRIISNTITTDDMTLVMDEPVTRVVLSFGKELKTVVDLDGYDSTTIVITKEELNVDSLLNIYFKIDVYDMARIADNSASTSSHMIEVINQLETKEYTAKKLKQDLDTLNYYEGIIQSLDTKLAYLEANDMFLNYLNFLVNNFYAKSFLNFTGKNDINQ